MKEKLLNIWHRMRGDKVDTTPDQFDSWLRNKLGEGLQGGDYYVTIGIVGQSSVPKIGEDFKLYGNVEKAEKKRKRLQRENPNIRLELLIVKNFYSVVRK